ncbi:MAG: hypothetical protein RL308_1004 [Bacteroidota bacterium]|jgi:rhamnosyltransferase
MNPIISILLSSYNGEKNICEQIDSLLNQSINDVKIFIRDDGSADNTKILLQKYFLKFPDKIILIDFEDNKNIGIQKSFERLMDASKEETYFAFCDQDDIWEPNKLEILLEKIKLIENENGSNTPALVFSDMEIVNTNVEVINKFFYKKNISFRRKINKGLFQGYVSGCLMLFNNAARNAYFYQDRNSLHDYNLFISTIIHGKTSFCPKALIKHRIHQNNYYGLSNVQPLRIEFMDLMKFLFKSREYRQIKLQSYFEFVAVFVS